MSARKTVWYGVNTALVKYVPQDTQYNKLDIFSVERISWEIHELQDTQLEPNTVLIGRMKLL